MSTETHEGVVAFRPLKGGSEQIVLGRVPIGEIGPVADPASLYPNWLRLDLPAIASHRHVPARDVADARRQALALINDWMIAAGVTPVGRRLGSRSDSEPSATGAGKAGST